MARKRIYPQPIQIGGHRQNGRITKTYPDPIHDAELFTRRYLDEALHTWGMYLRKEDYEDSIQELMRHLLRLEQIFDPERNDSFANYARTIIKRRAADAGPRRLLGRNGNQIHNHTHDHIDESNLHTRHNQTNPNQQSSDDPNWNTTPTRLQHHRNSPENWAKTILGI